LTEKKTTDVECQNIARTGGARARLPDKRNIRIRDRHWRGEGCRAPCCLADELSLAKHATNAATETTTIQIKSENKRTKNHLKNIVAAARYEKDATVVVNSSDKAVAASNNNIVAAASSKAAATLEFRQSYEHCRQHDQTPMLTPPPLARPCALPPPPPPPAARLQPPSRPPMTGN